MENDLSCGSGRQSDANLSTMMPSDLDYEYSKNMRNISVQTGEEFSPEFLRDRVSRRTPFTNDASQVPTIKPSCNAIQNHHHLDFSPGKAYAFDADKGYMDRSSTYQKKLSADFDKSSPRSAISVCSSDYSPNAKASGNLDRTLSGKIKFLCSFGGRILPRPNDAKLRYVGGDTRIISIRKDLTYNELVKKTSAVCSYPHMIKYQLPGEDLDALISVSSDEDLHHMIEEYHDLERKSQRLRIFLVSCGELEGPGPETRGRQKSDSDYQYVVAVNGMSPQRSLSRESLESQWMNNNPEESPTVQQKDPANAFRHLENLKLMLVGPGSSPPSSPSQFKDPKTSYVRTYDNVACPYGYQINCPYVVDTSVYDNPACVDTAPLVEGAGPVSSHVAQSHSPSVAGSQFHVASSEFLSSLVYGINGYTDESRGFLNPEKLVPPADMFCFSPVSDFHAKCTVIDASELALPSNDERRFTLEHGMEMSYQPFAVGNSPFIDASSSSQGVVNQRTAYERYLTLGNKDHTFQESSNLNKDITECGKGSTNWMENNEIYFDQDVKLSAVANNHASNSDFLEKKANLPQIICQPNSILSVDVPKSEPQLIGAKRSSSSSLCSSVENPSDVWKELSENYQISSNKPNFLIRSQRADSEPNQDGHNAIDGNTSFFGCHVLEPDVVRKEHNDQSNFIDLVQLPENESGLGLYTRGPLVLPETTVNDALGEVSVESITKEKPDRNSREEMTIRSATTVSSKSSDNVQEISEPEKPFVDEHSEESNYASEDDDDGAGIDDKDEPISDAAIIEMEASIYGLQIIKYADVEELQELGSGTFGTVYHGKWRGTDVAIKRIKKSCFAGGSSEQERLTKDFWREAKILSRLHHPNIVAFYGVVPDGPGGTLATVSEYMSNGSLRHVLTRKDRALDRRRKVIIALDASFGMEYLHLKNIVHFDLKCDNLLVNLGDSQRPVCKVTDFGLSRIKQNTLVSGGVRGTLPWMAPELLNGNSSRVSEKVDVFSFGIAMWEILTGEEPYIDMHCGAIIGGIVNNTLRPVIPERCDHEWRKLMEECWSHDPAARPSFTEITKRLQVMSTALQPKRFNNIVKR
ncbi:PB1 domain-containing protein tyrosine kinase [Striga hermonthica]|uniref:PB1 domain-containing protein tyrosine kinase n=1 Tax=Striga hermonthica TaxID=68872 RepID=A0A9N7MZS6_STRHE|nr:PB1 domain-containing protein tyrosine kinase [Striga hermonthica]